LKKGDRFKAATTAGTRVSLWSGRTGEYDITADRTSTRVDRATGKLRVARIRKSGTYYVAVTPGPASYAGVDYTLTLSRSR
jgi:hypothetical protein